VLFNFLFIQGLLVHAKMKILSSITHPHVVPNPQDFCSPSEHKLRFFLKKSVRFLTLH